MPKILEISIRRHMHWKVRFGLVRPEYWGPPSEVLHFSSKEKYISEKSRQESYGEKSSTCSLLSIFRVFFCHKILAQASWCSPKKSSTSLRCKKHHTPENYLTLLPQKAYVPFLNRDNTKTNHHWFTCSFHCCFPALGASCMGAIRSFVLFPASISIYCLLYIIDFDSVKMKIQSPYGDKP